MIIAVETSEKIYKGRSNIIFWQFYPSQYLKPSSTLILNMFAKRTTISSTTFYADAVLFDMVSKTRALLVIRCHN